MGGVFPGQGNAVIEHRLIPVVWDPAQLDELDAAAHAAGSPPGSIAIHLEIDSGMSRQGVAPGELDAILERFGPASPLRMEAVTTHLYASDESNGVSTAGQLERLEHALTCITAAQLSSTPEWLSVGASAALLGNDAQPIAALAERLRLKLMLRPGLALYGLVPRFEPPFGANQEPAALAASPPRPPARPGVEDTGRERARYSCGRGDRLQRDLRGDGTDAAGPACCRVR